MKIALASDHGGYELKEFVKSLLEQRGIEVTDLGTDSEGSVDYPDFGRSAAENVLQGETDRGIVVCGTGIGCRRSWKAVSGQRPSGTWSGTA